MNVTLVSAHTIRACQSHSSRPKQGPPQLARAHSSLDSAIFLFVCFVAPFLISLFSIYHLLSLPLHILSPSSFVVFSEFRGELLFCFHLVSCRVALLFILFLLFFFLPSFLLMYHLLSFHLNLVACGCGSHAFAFGGPPPFTVYHQIINPTRPRPTRAAPRA